MYSSYFITMILNLRKLSKEPHKQNSNNILTTYLLNDYIYTFLYKDENQHTIHL